jgi:hypothetical protein
MVHEAQNSKVLNLISYEPALWPWSGHFTSKILVLSFLLKDYFFRAGLFSQQKWEQGAKLSHVSLPSSCTGPPCPQQRYICYSCWADICHHHPNCGDSEKIRGGQGQAGREAWVEHQGDLGQWQSYFVGYTIVVHICHYTFAQAHRRYNTKRNPNVNALWVEILSFLKWRNFIAWSPKSFHAFGSLCKKCTKSSYKQQ